MAWPFSKPLADLTHEDLRELIAVPESDHLEFKREAYGKNDDQTREMLKDVSSFANAIGGYLLLGLDTDADEQASEIIGIPDADTEAARMLSSCRANIQDRITGLTFHTVPISDDRKVLICYIPRSSRAPHMITYKGLYQCWRRHGRQKDRMSIEEIRSACLRVFDLQRNLEQFIQERRSRFLEHVASSTYLLLMATPLAVRDESVDTSDDAVRAILSRPPNCRRGGWTVDCSVSGGGGPGLRPTLYGVTTEIENCRRLDLFRNGHLEFRAIVDAGCFTTPRLLAMRTDGRWLHPYFVAEYPHSFLHLVRAMMDQAGITDPVVISVVLANARGLLLWPHRSLNAGLRTEVVAWEDHHLELPSMLFPYPLQPGPAAKLIGDRIWNAFGFENCSTFDAEGNLRVGVP